MTPSEINFQNYIDFSVKDLEERYNKYGYIIIAVDFDHTIYNYDNNPLFNPEKIINLLKTAREEFDCKLVIYTARGKSRWNDVIKYCNSINLKFDELNEDVITLAEPTAGKIYYNIFLDDKAGLPLSVLVLETFIHKIQNKKIYDNRHNNK